jgi:16S rRNA (uracil1498-N3)-methyltransferase
VNLVLLFETDFISDNLVRLTDHRHQHIVEVLANKQGDQLRLGLANGNMGQGTIVAQAADYTQLEVQLDEPPPAKLPLSLLVALPRPKMARRIIHNATELGVKHLIFINSWRVEKSFWQSPLLKKEAVLQSCYTGLQQARDTIVPQVEFEPLFKPFVEDKLPDLLANHRGLLAHPGPGSAPCPDKVEQPICLAIGPEGGFIPYEIEKLVTAGMEIIQFGPRIMRVENAVTAITGRLFGGHHGI